MRIFLIISLLSAGCSRSKQWSEPIERPKSLALSEDSNPKEVARRLNEVYTNAAFIRFTGHLSGKPFDAGRDFPLLHLRAEAVMAPNKVKVEIYDGKALENPLTSILIDQFHGVQHLWAGDLVHQYRFAPDALGRVDSIPNTTPQLDRYGCLYGSLFQSWIGAGATMGEFFSNGIALSTFQGTEKIDAHNCWIYLWDRGLNQTNIIVSTDSMSILICLSCVNGTLSRAGRRNRRIVLAAASTLI